MIKTGNREININNPAISNPLKVRAKIMAVKKDNRVPTEAVQIIVKIMVGIKAISKSKGERAKRAPIKAANPLPPLKLRKQDQL